MVDVNEEVLTTNTVQFFYKELPGIITQRYVQAEIEKVLEKEKLRVNEVDPEVYASIKTSLKLQLFDIDKLGEESKDQELAIVGFFLGYIMFFFVFLYAVQVMRGVMEEKDQPHRGGAHQLGEALPADDGQDRGHRPGGLHAVPAVDRAHRRARHHQQHRHGRGQIQWRGPGRPADDRADAGGAGRGRRRDAQDRRERRARHPGPDRHPLVLALFGFYFLGGYLLYSSLFAAVGSAWTARRRRSSS